MAKGKEVGDDHATYHARIKDWPAGERPREKLLRHGPSALTDAELLALIIRSGTGRATAIDIAKKICRDHGSLPSIAKMTAPELMRLRGIGEAKAVELVAAFEIGRRVEGAPAEERTVIRSPEDVARIMGPLLRDLPAEQFHVLVLDARNGLKHMQEVTSGTLNASLAHPREVFKVAIDRGGAAVIVVHNHPSGNLEPSREDLEITRRLVDAGNVIDIRLHDHIIIAGNGYTSLADRGVV